MKKKVGTNGKISSKEHRRKNIESKDECCVHRKENQEYESNLLHSFHIWPETVPPLFVVTLHPSSISSGYMSFQTFVLILIRERRDGGK